MAAPTTTSAVHSFTVEPMLATDIPTVRDALNDAFTTREPTSVALGVTVADFTLFSDAILDASVASGLSLVARPQGSSGIAGFMLGTDFTVDPTIGKEFAQVMMPQLALLEELDELYVQRAFTDAKLPAPAPGAVVHALAGGTSSDYEGQGVAALLRKEQLRVAAAAGYSRLIVEATAGATQHIWCKLGGSVIAEIVYNTYEFEGVRMFPELTNPRSAQLIEVAITPSRGDVCKVGDEIQEVMQ